MERPFRPPAISGRGSAENPKNRFEKLELTLDPDEFDPDEPHPQTAFYRDTSRSIIAYNDSPDIGVDAGINPYRGCEHGCAYCLAGNTPILMADGTTKPLVDVRVGDAIYGTIRQGWYRRYVETRVLAHWQTHKPAYRVTLEDGTTLVASADHRFLTDRGWKFVTGCMSGKGQRPHLTLNNKLMGVGGLSTPPVRDCDYKRGYLCGMIRGDGLLASYTYERVGWTHGNQYQFRLALIDEVGLERTRHYLRHFGIETFFVPFPSSSKTLMHAIRTHAQGHIASIRELIAWPETPVTGWWQGFLAGVFDAEGSYSQGIWRLSNADPILIDHVTRGLKHLGFTFDIERLDKDRGKPLQAVRLRGGLKEHLRFFHTVDNAILRKRALSGQAVKSSARLGVIAVAPLETTLPLYDITTGTGDFIADGVVSHNCYARPSHEYLGFSAGLDFESKIMVKLDAPELLRQALASPRWQPQVIAMSGVTDCYQPVERKLRLTRRCLEVLLEFRNPVSVITKNHLVTRDLEVLSELARFEAISVGISLTTLDDALRRKLEPRTSPPHKRLEAVAKLAEAGVKVGVMTAPIIPGLNDHEIPSLINAAAEAGAQWCGYTVVHLPYGVKALFEAWLARHTPDRKERVLNRIREVRGGRLNDPRFFYRMRGEGPYAEQLRALHRLACARAGLPRPGYSLTTAHFRVPGRAVQGGLFEG